MAQESLVLNGSLNSNGHVINIKSHLINSNEDINQEFMEDLRVTGYNALLSPQMVQEEQPMVSNHFTGCNTPRAPAELSLTSINQHFPDSNFAQGRLTRTSACRQDFEGRRR